MSFSPIIKDPLATAHLRFEYGQPGGVPIAAIRQLAITPAGRVTEVVPLAMTASHAGSTYAMVSVGGGTDGELYLIECTVEDSAGDAYQQRQEVLAVDLAWRVPGAPLPSYVDIAGFVARAGLDRSIFLTDEHGSGAIGAERLERALLDAQAIVDSYLGVRYAVPLILPPPPPIPTITYDLAVARLYTGELPDELAARQKEALRMLADLRDGDARIAADVAAAEQQAGPVLFHKGRPLFSRDKLKGW